MFLGQYPQQTAADPDIYVRQLVTLLAHYPAEIVHTLAHPMEKPVGVSAFVPSIPQVKVALDREAARLTRKRDCHRAVERQIAMRNEPINKGTPEEREEAIARWEQTKAEMLANAETVR